MSGNAILMRFSSEQEVTEASIGERRLWTAVLIQAVRDWRNGTLRARRDAQHFLFEDDAEFDRVCAGAGLEPGSLRSKLLKIGRKIHTEGPSPKPLAA